MNNKQLDELLKSASVPERAEAYWEQFPGRVLAKWRWGQASQSKLESAKQESGAWRLGKLPALGLGLALVGIVVGFGLGFWRGRHSSGTELEQLAQLRQCVGELQTLFPNQLQAVVFEPAGPRLVLAERPTVPLSQPIYLKVQGPSGLLRVVTYSGQQLQLNGEACEVLLDRQGQVLVVGQNWVWSNSLLVGKSGPYRIEAGLLGAS